MNIFCYLEDWILLLRWAWNFVYHRKNQMVGSVGSIGSHTILRSYTILHDPTNDPNIFAILIRFYSFWWGGIVKSCDFTIRIAILTTLISALRKKEDSFSSFGHLISSVKQILVNCNCISFSHTRRRGTQLLIL